MPRDTSYLERIRYDDHSQPPPVPDYDGPPSPPVHPKLEHLRRQLSTLRTPIDPVREARQLRDAILSLAEDVYAVEQREGKKPARDIWRAKAVERYPQLAHWADMGYIDGASETAVMDSAARLAAQIAPANPADAAMEVESQ